jgi:hypothetical protein
MLLTNYPASVTIDAVIARMREMAVRLSDFVVCIRVMCVICSICKCVGMAWLVTRYAQLKDSRVIQNAKSIGVFVYCVFFVQDMHRKQLDYRFSIIIRNNTRVTNDEVN